MPRKVIVCILCLFLMSCGSVEEITGNTPIVDTKGVDLALFEADLGECQAYADQVDIAARTTTAAAAGAITGGLIGAAVGNGETARRGAGAGAATGAVSGVGSGLSERGQVIRRCLSGRGYRVLN